MDKGKKVRFAFIVLLWLWLCYMVIAGAKQITFWEIFSIVTSGIIVFVPLYKRYYKNKKED